MEAQFLVAQCNDLGLDIARPHNRLGMASIDDQVHEARLQRHEDLRIQRLSRERAVGQGERRTRFAYRAVPAVRDEDRRYDLRPTVALERSVELGDRAIQLGAQRGPYALGDIGKPPGRVGVEARQHDRLAAQVIGELREGGGVVVGEMQFADSRPLRGFGYAVVSDRQNVQLARRGALRMGSKCEPAATGGESDPRSHG